jgi:type II secretory pathway component GspD/PulD (secretin)
VPLLGDIPLLGALFSRKVSTKTQTELLVFLTPQVVQKPSDLADLTRQLRGEMQRLDAAVEPGVLLRHLDQLANLKVSEPIQPAPPAAPGAGK